MVAHAGEYLAQRHPAGSEPVKAARFPGPQGAGWVNFVEEGFRKAIADSAARVVVTKSGDAGKEIQLLLIEDVLEERPDIDYIVGSAVTAEAAISILRARAFRPDPDCLRLLHSCRLSRHQARPDSGGADRLPRAAGTPRHRPSHQRSLV
jgi:ABC-type sugar transport system substrate-binding protein